MSLLDMMRRPADPLVLLGKWLAAAEARSKQPNFNTMMLATVGPGGRPSVRAVLYKEYDPATGRLAFYTNYRSRKAREIESNPQVALAMHWAHLDRQVRIEGRAERTPPEVADAYFRTRSRESQVGAWASDQSEPLDSWATLTSRVARVAATYVGRSIPRPEHWGGYVVTPESVEFWMSGVGRVHPRVLYTRNPEAPHGWISRRLFP